MFEALELECVAAGVEEEHGRLLSRLSRVADSGLENEGNPRRADAIGQGRKCIPLQQVGVTAPVVCAEIWFPKKSKSTQVSVLRPSGQPRISP